MARSTQVRLVVVAAGLLSIAATNAVAAPAASCRLVTDPIGDVKSPYIVETPSSALDIVSADVATGRHALTVVVRVRKMQMTPPTAPRGHYYIFWFSVREERFSIWAGRMWNGDVGTVYRERASAQAPTASGNLGTGLGYADVRFDPTRSEAVAVVPLSLFDTAGGIPRHARLYQIQVWAHDALGFTGPTGPTAITDDADRAITKKTYLAGAASCVRST
ncbi:MAG: hypothetical protein ABR520_03260 [Mycobacteriales bacterium]|nr:hypothetical protein [Frankia sp.]